MKTVTPFAALVETDGTCFLCGEQETVGLVVRLPRGDLLMPFCREHLPTAVFSLPTYTYLDSLGAFDQDAMGDLP